MLKNPSNPAPTTSAHTSVPPTPSLSGRTEALDLSTLQAAAEDARLIERLLLSPCLLHHDARRIRIVASFLKSCLREIENGSKVVRPVALPLILRLSE